MTTGIIRYKGIQIFCTDFNIAFGKILIPYLKLAIVVVFMFCFFAIVRLVSAMNILAFAMVLISFISCAVLLLPMAIMMSSLYDTSTQYRPNIAPMIENISDRNTRKQVRCQLKGCSLIRCQVGNMYHMEAKAKLTLLQNIVTGIACLLVNVHV